MGNKAVLPAGKDTIGVEFIEGDATNNILRMTTSATADTNSWSVFTYSGTAKDTARGASLQLFGANHATQPGDAILATPNDVVLDANYSAGVSGCRLFMDGSTGAMALSAINAFSLSSSSLDISGSTTTYKGSVNAQFTNDNTQSSIIHSSGGSITPSTIDYTKGAALQLFGTTSGGGQPGRALMTAPSAIDLRANFSGGVSGAQLFMDASNGDVTFSSIGQVTVTRSTATKPHLLVLGQTTGLGGAGKSVIQLDVNGNGGFAISNDASSGARTFSIDDNNGFGSGTTNLLTIRPSDFRSPAINSNTTASAANVFIQSSDGRLFRSTSAAKYKSDVQPLTRDALDANLLLEGVFYRSLCEEDCKAQQHVGIVADQAEPYSPWLIHYGSDNKIEGFQYERQTAFNLEHIKRLTHRLDDALERINELEEILYGPADLETV